jgi:glyoxylase-like metal-dependent hydrolase (beta-lactamase superfamily II)
MDEELIIEQLEIGPMRNFVYVVGSRSTREVVLVDPAWDIDALLEHLDARDYRLSAALITHYHPDHIGGAFGGGHDIEGLAALQAKRPVKVYANRAEAAGVKQVTGLSDSDLVKIDSGERLKIGRIDIEFLHTPGHTPGSQCFRVSNALVSGDTLFIQGCGRVDLPGSDAEQMYHSLRKLADLPDDTVLFPGHNYDAVPTATMADTKARNPYLQIRDLDRWRRLMSG